MSGSNIQPHGPIPNFPGIGPIGGMYVSDGSFTTGANMTVNADGSITVNGYVLISILAELRVQSQLLQTIANVTDQLSQMRADAVADMGVLYQPGAVAPIPSS